MPRPAKERDRVFSIWALRLGSRSLHSTLGQAGAQNSQSPVDAEEGGDATSVLFRVRRHRSILLTFKKLMIGKLGRPCLFRGHQLISTDASAESVLPSCVDILPMGQNNPRTAANYVSINNTSLKS